MPSERTSIGGVASALSIRWTVQHRGWARCEVADEHTRAEASASFVTNAPEDFLHAIATLLDGRTEARVEFDDEPVVYRWFFRREGADVDIRLVTADDRAIPDGGGTVVWSSRRSIDALCRAAVRAFDTVLWKLGEDGYRSDWGRPFPRRELEALRNAWRAAAGPG